MSPLRPLAYAEATHVELGCNHVTGKNASDDLVYEIHFPGGESFDLDEAKPVTGSWLDNAERIDAELQWAGARFVRWGWLRRNPLHPSCLAVQYTGPGPNRRERIDRLLRAGGAPLASEP